MIVGNWNQQFVKVLNLNKILNQLRMSDVTSRVELSKRLNLSKSTITSLISLLIESGCVEEVGRMESALGRRLTSLRLKASWKHVLVIHFDTPAFHLAILDLKGTIICERRLFFDEHQQEVTWHFISELMKKSAEALCLDANLNWESDIIGISIAIPGIIDSHAGKAWSRIIMNHSGVSIQELLMNTFKKRVLVDNDVRALSMALGREAGDETSDMVTLLVSKGVGAGIISNGKLVRGGVLGAGQIGHIKVSEEGPLCHCGQRGCLESFVANDAVIRTFSGLCKENPNLEKRALKLLSKSVLDQIEIKDIGILANLNVKEALEIIDGISINLAKVLHSIVQMLNPSKILLAGPLFDEVAHLMIPKIIQKIGQLTQAYLSANTHFQVITNYEEQIISGIANFILDEVYAPPIYRESGEQEITLTDFMSNI